MKKAPFLLFFISMAFNQAIEASPVNEDLLKQMYKNISKPSPRRPEANHNNDRNSPEPNFAYN